MAVFDEDSLLQGADTAIQDRIASAMAANTTQPTDQTLATQQAAAPVPAPAPVAAPTAAQPAPGGQANRLLNMLFSLTSGPGGDKTLKQAASQLFDLNPPQLQGPDVISTISGGAPSRGGILGTGVEPIDVLALAIGGLITSRMPQAQALETTMKIAQLPSQFKANQRKSAEQFIDNVLKASQVENATMENQRKLLELQRKEKFFGTVQPGQTQLTPEQKFAGVAAGVLPASILEQKTQVVEVGGQKRLIDMATGNTVAELGTDKTAKLSESGFAQLSDPAQEFIVQTASRRGVDIPTVMTDTKVVDEAIRLSQADRTLQRNMSQQRINVTLAQNGLQNEQTLRAGYLNLPTIKDYQDIQSGFSRMNAVAQQPPSAGRDMALIYNFMKINDPTSVVRESEFKTAEQMRSWLTRSEAEGRIIPSSVKLAIQKLTPSQKGSFLLPDQVVDFVGTGRTMFQSQKKLADSLLNTYRGLAAQSGLRPEAIPDISVTPAEAPSADLVYDPTTKSFKKVKK